MYLLLESENLGGLYLFLGIALFFVGVFVTRWIFGITKIISILETNNERSLIQIRLLKKMLINSGVPFEEIDDIIDNGNKKK